MRYYELTIKTKEPDPLLEKVISYLPGRLVRQEKTPSFFSLEFYSPPEKISELEKKLKSDSLKYLILAKNLPKKVLVSPARKPRRTVVAPKVELKEIEKKLEEILKET